MTLACMLCSGIIKVILDFICDRRQQMHANIDNVEMAPEFSLPGINESGGLKTYTLDQLLSQGKYLVIYFYPKDDTP